MHPLAPEAGGDGFHSGGHQFASQDDPDWQVLAAWVRQKPPAEYTNLKVLKSNGHLMDVMRAFNISLGAECTFCHVASDFSSDARPTKLVARQMIQLTDGLSTTLGNGNVTCYTCHRGNEKPRTVHPRFPNLKYPL
jgi:cytochrome c553